MAAERTNVATLSFNIDNYLRCGKIFQANFIKNKTKCKLLSFNYSLIMKIASFYVMLCTKKIVFVTLSVAKGLPFVDKILDCGVERQIS